MTETYFGTLPDLCTKTHFIALCGTPEEDANPKDDGDGWFLSDFYLFNQVFQGLGSSRAWVTCADPNNIINTYHEYAHGNPWQTRRIVLDKDTQPTDVKIFEETELLGKFLDLLEKQCEIAEKAEEPIFLMIFGHGDAGTHGVYIGKKGAESLGVSDKEDRPLLNLDTIRSILQRYPKVQLGILLTSCFSGGWTIDMNVTAMAAADSSNTSDAWTDSTSMGRACGSIFASAVVELLIKEDQEESGFQISATDYKTFTEGVRTKIFKLDILSSEPAFSAQDDQWTAEYHKRTGIPLSEYKKRIDSLRTIPSTSKIDYPYGDRSSEDQLNEWNQRNGFINSMRRRTGDRPAVERAVQAKARLYLASHPGKSNAASNRPIHALIRICDEGTATEDQLEKLLKTVLYREGAGVLSQALRDVMGLETFPNFIAWDFGKHELEHPSEERFGYVAKLILKAELIPKPLSDEGHQWTKPWQYLTAACIAENLTNDEIKATIAKAQEFVGVKKEETKRVVVMELRGRGGMRNWFDAMNFSIGKSLGRIKRSISPRKRRSLSPEKGDTPPRRMLTSE